MRRVLSLLVLGLLAGPISADKVVLRDGRTLDTKKPPVIKGRQAVLQLADGKLVSIPAAEIDLEKTAALAKAAAAAPASQATPVSVTAPSLVDAARSGQTAKKAAVVLTDQDVAGGYNEPPSGTAEKGDAEVVVGPVTTKKGPAGYSVEGSVQNSGKARALGVGVTIEAFGEGGKSIASTFGQLAKDNLEPGEKATFRAQIDTDQTVTRFTYLPRWQAPVRTPGEGEPAAAQSGKKPADGKGEGTEPPPPPAPTPAPEPTQPPRQPDYAAPPANAPVGAPAQPGGTYLPPPSTDQPKPPGGGV